MTNHSLILWLLLFLDGVSGAVEVSVSVMKGDSVTLHTGVSVLQTDNKVDWTHGDGTVVAEIENNKIKKEDPDRLFKGRLQVDNKTGSLTIKNITTEDKGFYKLDIGGKNDVIYKNFNVTIRDDLESVSVMEGDSVTLHTSVTQKQKDDQILWKFGDQDLNGADAGRENIHLNDQTGDLNITNIQKDQSGDYKMEINTNRMILHRKFRIINSDEIKTVTVQQGESIILRTGVIEIRGFDLIMWKFEDHCIAEISKKTNQFSLYETLDKKFGGRLHPDHQTGSLTISNSKTSDSGDYNLNMSKNTYSLQRTISVTVSGLSLALIGVICVCPPLLLAIALVIYFRYKLHKERQKQARGNVLHAAVPDSDSH